MSANRRILDDVAKLATSAAGLVQGAGREAETLLRQRLERLLDRMDLITREEFDVVKAMAAKARMENEALAKRLAALEKAIQPVDAPPTPRAAAARTPKAAAKTKGKPATKAKKANKSAKK
ncbi:MAG: accessory factor UbiK family protein [Alphaproteobacteria bacterium]|jgi:BMFP domain-containing protein YqiC